MYLNGYAHIRDRDGFNRESENHLHYVIFQIHTIFVSESKNRNPSTLEISCAGPWESFGTLRGDG